MVQFTSRQQNYRDLDLDFLPHPATKDVVKKIGVDAIKRSVRNLILTNFYDRPFRHYIGSNVQKLLFENINPITANQIDDAIRNVLNNYEPRIEITDVKVVMMNDQNAYAVSINFIIKNTSTPVIFNFFLERIR
jgi:phage baseplate assembly protein W